MFPCREIPDFLENGSYPSIDIFRHETLNVDDDEMRERIYGSHLGADLFRKYLYNFQFLCQALPPKS
jgi:hypothetical protein